MKQRIRIEQIESVTYEFDKDDIVNALMDHFYISAPLGQNVNLLLLANSPGKSSTFKVEMTVRYIDKRMLTPPNECPTCFAIDSLEPTKLDPGIYVCNLCKTRFVGDEDKKCFWVEPEVK